MSNWYRKKLYFDYNLAAATNQIFPCTNPTGAANNGVNPERVGYTGDRYGGVFEALAPLTAGFSGRARLQRSVSAWCQPMQTALATAVFATAVMPLIEFVAATTVSDPATTVALNINSIPPGDPRNAEVTSRFGVRVRKATTSSATLGWRGVLHVQRQHSLEV